MRRICAILACFAGLALFVPVVPGEEPAGEWIELFDGKTLNGWIKPFDWGEAWVEDGEIRLRGDKKFFLVYDRVFRDFELEVEVNVPVGGNSGIQFRSHFRHNKLWGYQAEVDTSPRRWAGGLYDEGRRGWLVPLKDQPEKQAAFKNGQWNHYRIKAVGAPYPDLGQRCANGRFRGHGREEPRSVRLCGSSAPRRARVDLPFPEHSNPDHRRRDGSGGRTIMSQGFSDRARCTAVAAVVWTALAMPMMAGVAPPERPNIVWLISDDQRWDDYSFMGHPWIQTPNLDRLASQSLVFERGYVPTSLCRPSLASMITGLYPHQHGVTGNDPAENRRDPAARQRIVDRFLQNPRLPAILREHGYFSFQAGKWWEGHYSNGGFTHGMTHGDVTRGGRHGDVGLTIGRQTMQPVYDFIDMAVAEGKPFFLWFAPMMPHLPHNPPDRLLEKYRRQGHPLPVARYYAMCEWWDEKCGELLAYLEGKNLTENTIVFYVCDNGWVQRQDGPGGPFGGPRGKRSAYDGGIRTPIMIRWPGKVQPRRDKESLATSLDLVPTVLAALEITAPRDFPGINLLDPGAVESRSAVFGEIYLHDIVDLRDPTQSLLHRWVLTRDWKYIWPTSLATGEFGPTGRMLSRIRLDPEEKINVAHLYPEQVTRCEEQIVAEWGRTGEGSDRDAHAVAR